MTNLNEKVVLFLSTTFFYKKVMTIYRRFNFQALVLLTVLRS